MPTPPPQIIDQEADQEFHDLAREMGLDPGSQWVGGYVDYEWKHSAHVFRLACNDFSNMNILEFGCNYGATAIILASLGARVSAIDVDSNNIRLARANARRYGLDEKIDFLHVTDSSSLPFSDESFHAITCNSVLEYIPPQQLTSAQREINRLLKNKGLLFVLGTSNRLWPKEVHSRKLFTNYIPRWMDRVLYPQSSPERGLFPWEILKGFNSSARYANCDAQDAGRVYIEARRKMGVSESRLRLLQLAHRALGILGLSAGLVTPSISVILRKKAYDT